MSNLCFPVTQPIKVTVTGQAPGQSWELPDITSAQVDPKVDAQARALGFLNDGLIERFVTALLHGLLLLVAPLLTYWISIQDAFYAGLAELLTKAQGEGATGFYQLSAALVSDLFGVTIDGNALASQYTSGGRLAAVNSLGGSIVNILASEFMGVYQSSGASGYSVPDGTGIGGLPAAAMTPEQGVKAARAFLGFATEFGVREGNAEMVAKSIPYNLGEGVRELAVTVARGVNLGRMGRIALMPLFRGLVATPLQWAINKQYHPALLGPPEAIQAWLAGDLTADQMTEILDRHGYDATAKQALAHHHAHQLSPAELEVLWAARQLADQDYTLALARHGYDTDTITQLRAAADLAPQRRLSLAYAERILTEYLEGKIPQGVASSFLDGVAANNAFLISPGEMAGLRALLTANVTAAVHPKHLTPAQWRLAYYAGLATLPQLENAISADYPDPTEAQIVLFEDLLGQAKYEIAQDRLAIAAAKYGVSVPILPKI